MTVFARLGLQDGATEAEVKRAYARLLKANRPDGDPVAFQQLQETYNQCLLWVRRRQYDGDGVSQAETLADSETEPPPETALEQAEFPEDTSAGFLPADPLPAVNRSPALDFDLSSFIEQFSPRLLADDPRALDRWLHSLEAFYSLPLKQSLRPWMAQFLAGMERPANPPSMQVALEFFALDQLSRGPIADEVFRAMQRSEAADAFERNWRNRRSWHLPWGERVLMRELEGPFSRWRRVLLMLLPQFPGRLKSLAELFLQLDSVQAHARFDAAAIRFWYQSADKRQLARPRLAVAALRIPVYALIASLLANFAAGPLSEVTVFFKSLGIFTAAWLIYAAGLVGLIRLDRWTALRLEWDRHIQLAAMLAVASAIALPFWPLALLPLLGLAILLWLAGRGVAVLWLGIATAVSGAILWGTIVAPLSLDLEWKWALTVALVMASLVLQDLLHARSKRIALFLARRGPAWLGWLLGCNLVGVAILAFVGGSPA